MQSSRSRLNVDDYWRSFLDVPNLLTCTAAYLSVIAGVWLATLSTKASLSWPLLCAAVPIGLDFVDGAIARRFFSKAPGRRLGGVLDTMADFAAFGCLPASVILSVLGTRPVMLATSGLWLFCAHMRLAHFSYSEGHLPPRTFVGLPSPYAAGLFLMEVAIGRHVSPSGTSTWICGLAAVTAFSMLVPFHFRKPTFVANIGFTTVVMLVILFV